jgi:hypothetical protein
VTAALIAILVLLVGLPLLFWWIGGRRTWSRLDARGLAAGRLSQEAVARHGLRGGEVDEVRTAMAQGRALDDPRLRAAVVDWAGEELASIDGRRFGVLRTRAGIVGTGAVLTVLLAVATVLTVTADDGVRWTQWVLLVGNWLTTALLLLLPFLQRRALQRAIERNRD